MTAFTQKSLSHRWTLKFVVFSDLNQCLMWRCFCCSLWWSKQREALTQQPEQHFCCSLEEVNKFLLYIFSLWSYSAWIQLFPVRKDPHAICCIFFPQPATGPFWVCGSGTVTPLDWPATASFHLNHQVSAFKDFFFSCSCNSMCRHLENKKVLFYSCLSHSWVSLSNKSEQVVCKMSFHISVMRTLM